jgi:hypothetical protein
VDPSDINATATDSPNRRWVFIVAVALMAFLLPVVLAIGFAKPGISQEEQAKILAAEAQAHARVSLADLHTARRALEAFLETDPPPAEFPADGRAAYAEFYALARAELQNFERYQSINQRAAAGEQSPEIAAELRQMADAMAKKAQAFNGLQSRISAAEREWQAAQELARRLAEEKRKRETGEGLGMTMEGFLFLKDGMSKWEIDLIFDCPGELSVQSDNLEIYEWRSGFKGVNCTFRNGQLISKAQFGL